MEKVLAYGKLVLLLVLLGLVALALTPAIGFAQVQWTAPYPQPQFIYVPPPVVYQPQVIIVQPPAPVYVPPTTVIIQEAPKPAPVVRERTTVEADGAQVNVFCSYCTNNINVHPGEVGVEKRVVKKADPTPKPMPVPPPVVKNGNGNGKKAVNVTLTPFEGYEYLPWLTLAALLFLIMVGIFMIAFRPWGCAHQVPADPPTPVVPNPPALVNPNPAPQPNAGAAATVAAPNADVNRPLRGCQVRETHLPGCNHFDRRQAQQPAAPPRGQRAAANRQPAARRQQQEDPNDQPGPEGWRR